MEENSQKWSKVVEDDSQLNFWSGNPFLWILLKPKTDDLWLLLHFVCVFFGVSMNNRFIGKLTFCAKITKLWFLLEHTIRKVKFLSQQLKSPNPQHFHEFFTPKNSTIFSGNQSWIFGQKMKISNSVCYLINSPNPFRAWICVCHIHNL